MLHDSGPPQRRCTACLQSSASRSAPFSLLHPYYLFFPLRVFDLRAGFPLSPFFSLARLSRSSRLSGTPYVFQVRGQSINKKLNIRTLVRRLTLVHQSVFDGFYPVLGAEASRCWVDVQRRAVFAARPRLYLPIPSVSWRSTTDARSRGWTAVIRSIQRT